jgi:3-methyladenine DNA glycosylase AlkD
MNLRRGAPENQFGVKAGDIRAIAKSIKVDHELGLELWNTGNVDAMLLATLLAKPKLFAPEELEAMAASVPYTPSKTATVSYTQVADWLMTNVIRQHPGKEALRQRWMESSHPMLSRAGWSLTTERVSKNPEGLDLGALLDRIEAEVATAPAAAQWTMNYCVAEIGIRFMEHRDRAIAIGERFGLYRDYPVSKGCVSPFAPIWIREMVARAAQD